MGYVAHCEISPGGVAEISVDSEDEARAFYQKCQAGAIQMDPANTPAKCGWWGPDAGGMTAHFARAGYACARAAVATLPTPTKTSTLSVVSSAQPSRGGMGTSTKVALGLAALGALYLAVK